MTMGWDQAETGMEGDSGELFAATKGAIMAFTRSLALSLAPTVRVNAPGPGLDQDRLGRVRLREPGKTGSSAKRPWPAGERPKTSPASPASSSVPPRSSSPGRSSGSMAGAVR